MGLPRPHRTQYPAVAKGDFLELQICGVHGYDFNLRVSESISGKDLLELVRGYLPSKRGAALWLLWKDQKISLTKTLKEEGLRDSPVVNYVFARANMPLGGRAVARNMLTKPAETWLDRSTAWKTLKCRAAGIWSDGCGSDEGLEGLTAVYYEGRQLETILNQVRISGTVERVVFEHFDRSLKHVVFPKNLQSLTFSYNFNQSLKNVRFPKGSLEF
ncbi:unnamed protein product [Cladocopium goreaui]|uniref:Uncharacterized protein n=1 Tax=Cladocopium goreaui TaxID=2562237 RepID=A0A9P1G9K2_9DINO|nr:unnamed protein product [Cladocopium goreaui]